MSGASGRASTGARLDTGVRHVGRIFMQVLWPGFLMAIIAEGIFFSMVDPQDLPVVGRYLGNSREAAYTIAFFVFWILAACSSGITFLLSRTDRE